MTVPLSVAFKVLGIEDRQKECLLFVRDIQNLEIMFAPKRDLAYEKEKERVRKFWEEHLKTYPEDTDGPIASLMNLARDKKDLKLTVRRKKFSDHLHGLACRSSKLLFNGSTLDRNNALALSVGAITLTKPSEKYPKGCIIFSQRKQTPLNCGEYTLLPSGYLDPAEDCYNEDGKKYLSLAKALNREFGEELPGLRPYFDFKILGLIYVCVGSKQPLIVVSIKIPYTAEEAMSILGSRKPDREVENYFCVPADIESLREFFKKYPACSDAVYRTALWVADNYNNI